MRMREPITENITCEKQIVELWVGIYNYCCEIDGMIFLCDIPII